MAQGSERKSLADVSRGSSSSLGGGKSTSKAAAIKGEQQAAKQKVLILGAIVGVLGVLALYLNLPSDKLTQAELQELATPAEEPSPEQPTTAPAPEPKPFDPNDMSEEPPPMPA